MTYCGCLLPGGSFSSQICFSRQVLQPHYSHVPFALQFMMDYNLQGMNCLDLRCAMFRRKTSGETSEASPSESADEDAIRKIPKSKRTFDEASIPASYFLPETVARLTSCELEIDGVAADILNTNSSLLSESILGSVLQHR